ncbi:phasin family protein [Ferrimonas lipolytica]|uniref:Phasin family protein n=1 Tax=Ferrimonas lipolytica TaxID=2724191 RepID=A0A6H1U924_9GAMM|nr:phasin family protein [Ferrimonas lipolytica]QIZ75541.1 phasin family protein [Ferrimonas lipolytica]
MSTRQAKKTVRKEDALARKIWLAGLGAYAMGSKEITNITDRSRTWLDDLIDHGRAMEDGTKDRWRDASEQTTQAVAERVNSRVQKITGLDPTQLDELDAKLDQLAATMDKLATAKPVAAPKAAAPKPPVTPKIAATKPAVKTPAPRRAAKPVAKKES